jgi:hypothetical protein
MQAAREVTDDGNTKWVDCSGCKHPRPFSWYTKDVHTLLGIGYLCRSCRPKGNKLKVVDPDYEVIRTVNAKPLRPEKEKMAAGSWERVVRRAALCAQYECVIVYVGKENYLSRQSALSGLHLAAKRMKMKISIRHGRSELYVKVKE